MPIKPTYRSKANWGTAITLIAALGICLGSHNVLAQIKQADFTGLPQEQRQGDVKFISGGVGLNESEAIRREVEHWPLALRFSSPNSDYLTGVRVYITDTHGGEILQADSRGPYMLVRLRPGRYIVHARYQENEQTQPIEVSGKGAKRMAFLWSTWD